MNWYDSASVLLDSAGNTLSQGNLTMTYNQANRLATVGTIGPFTYHADGLRITKPSPNGTTIFHYDLDGQLIAETNDAGGLVRVYFWADEIPIAQYDTQLTYLHVDHLNTPRIGTSDTGAIVWTWQSDGFGSTLPNEDPDGNGQVTTVNLRFPGQYYDVETGLHYNYFRDYNPKTGRYIESDPIGLVGGLNTYSYVYGNPVSYADPGSLTPVGVSIGVGVRVVGGRAAAGAIGAGTGARAWLDPTAGGIAACVLAGVCVFNEGETPARGLPPKGVKPPIEGECKSGPASCPAEQSKGGQNLRDPNGGEWCWQQVAQPTLGLQST